MTAEPYFGGRIVMRRDYAVEIFDKVIDGYQCRALFGHRTGYFCGYVIIPETDICYKLSHSEIENLWVHGGITFDESAHIFIDNPDGRIIGFDCAHLRDAPYYKVIQKYPSVADRFGGEFRDLEFVWGECERLIEQIKIWNEMANEDKEGAF